MPYLKIDDLLEIHYQIDDFTNPWDHRPTLILQHGNGRSGAFWYQWIPYLARHFRIVRPDMRGVGKSTPIQHPEKHIQIQDCINDLVKLIEHLGDGPVYYCGESMGGILGIVLAATQPHLVKSLALIATPVYINQDMKEKYALGFSSRLEAMEKLGIEDWVRKTSVMARFPPETHPELINWYVKEFAKTNPEILIHYSDLVSSANATQYLQNIQCPTLAVMPSNGPITDPQQIELLRSSIKNLQIKTIASDYHMIHLTHVAECATCVMNFFNPKVV